MVFDIHIIESGYIMADGGAMFGAIPKRAWQRKYACDEDNLCRLAMRCLLAVSADRKILVDTGIGATFSKDIAYYQPHNLVCIEEAIAQYGYSAADITDVVLTHMHFDHCGYATRKNEKGEFIPAFPNASYWLSNQQWENVVSPNELEKDSIFANNVLPVYEAGQLSIVDKDISLCDGVELRLFDGHSKGQLVPFIKSKDGICVFPGDLVPTSAHVSLEWISAYDICALTSYSEKKRFLDEAEREKYTLMYCHDAYVAKSKVKKLNDNFKATELFHIDPNKK